MCFTSRRSPRATATRAAGVRTAPSRSAGRATSSPGSGSAALTMSSSLRTARSRGSRHDKGPCGTPCIGGKHDERTGGRGSLHAVLARRHHPLGAARGRQGPRAFDAGRSRAGRRIPFRPAQRDGAAGAACRGQRRRGRARRGLRHRRALAVSRQGVRLPRHRPRPDRGIHRGRAAPGSPGGSPIVRAMRSTCRFRTRASISCGRRTPR